MRVGILLEGSRIRMGGGERVLLSLVDGFKREGWDVRLVLCTWADSPGYEDVADFFGSSVRPDKVVSLAFPQGMLSYYRRYFLYRRIAKIFQDRDAVIRVYGYPVLSNLLRSKYFCYVQESVGGLPLYLRKNQGFAEKLYRAPLTRTYRKSGDNVKFVTVSEFVKHNIEITWGKTSVVIPPPVDISHYEELASRNSDNKAHHKIVSVGRFYKSKNQMEQLMIIETLCSHNSEWKLVMLGSAKDPASDRILNELKQAIHKRRIEKNVLIVENASRGDLDKELSTSEYFLHTNHREGFGISVVEAIAAGCVPVVPREGGTGEIVSSELTFSSVPEAVDIFKRLSEGWRPHSVFSEKLDYSERAFQQRWIELLLAL